MTPPANLPDLPYELLASILIDANSAAPQLFCISISHVCRRLRQFALSVPQLWTHVSNYQSLDEVDTFLARSKDEKLVVYLLAMRRDGSNCQQFLKRVVPHRARWRVFGFEANELRRRFFLELAKIRRESSSQRVQLPALEKLDLQCYDPSYELDEDLQIWGVLYFWKAWEMPNLRDLTISMVDENVSEDWHAFGTELTTLRAHYRDVYWEEYDLTSFVDLVGRFRNLRNLELSFFDVKEERVGLYGADFSFPTLESLQFYFGAEAFSVPNNSFETYAAAMRIFETPQLLQFALRVESREKRDIINWLRYIDNKKMKILQKVYVCFQNPPLRTLFLLPPKKGAADQECPDEAPSLFADPDGMTKRDLPEIELSGRPKGRNSTFGDHILEDKNVREVLQEDGWFRPDVETDEHSD